MAIALITGTSRGIGLATAVALGRAGSMVNAVLAGYAASTRWVTPGRSRSAATNSVAVRANCSAWQYAGKRGTHSSHARSCCR
jgi:NAD(P)-dependent dehydrogenase (short-subunit alcohol dehydrogenase family)